MITTSQEYLQRLAEIQNSSSTVYSALPSDEPRFIINANTRVITIPSEFGFLAVLKDHKAETIYFEIDRYFDDVDLSSKTCVVQFELYDNTNTVLYQGICPITEMDVTTIEGKIIFGWSLTNDVTQFASNIRFSVRFYSLEEIQSELEPEPEPEESTESTEQVEENEVTDNTNEVTENTGEENEGQDDSGSDDSGQDDSGSDSESEDDSETEPTYIFSYSFNTLAAESIILDTLDIDHVDNPEILPSVLQEYLDRMQQLNSEMTAVIQSAEDIVNNTATEEEVIEYINTDTSVNTDD